MGGGIKIDIQGFGGGSGLALVRPFFSSDWPPLLAYTNIHKIHTLLVKKKIVSAQHAQ